MNKAVVFVLLFAGISSPIYAWLIPNEQMIIHSEGILSPIVSSVDINSLPVVYRDETLTYEIKIYEIDVKGMEEWKRL